MLCIDRNMFLPSPPHIAFLLQTATLADWTVRYTPPTRSHEWQLVFQAPALLSASTVIFHKNPGMFGVTLSNWFTAQQAADCEAFFPAPLAVTRCSTSSHLRLSNAPCHSWELEEADGCRGASLHNSKEKALKCQSPFGLQRALVHLLCSFSAPGTWGGKCHLGFAL